MREQILNDLVISMKKQDKETLSVLRLLKGAIQLEEINKKSALTDEEIIQTLSRQIKTRKESISEFEKAGRIELIEQTKKEIEILNKYMPEQLSLDEVNKIINKAFDVINPVSKSDMGKIMSHVNPLLKGKSDMSYVSKIIRERLENVN